MSTEPAIVIPLSKLSDETLAELIRALRQEEANIPKTPTEAATGEAAPQPAKPGPAITKEMIRAKAADLARAGKTQEIKVALAAVNADRLSEVAQTRYPELWELLEGISNG